MLHLPLPDPHYGRSGQAASLLVIAVWFGLIFKYPPDAQVAWRDVAPGALFTAVWFVIGKFALSVYLGAGGGAVKNGRRRASQRAALAAARGWRPVRGRA